LNITAEKNFSKNKLSAGLPDCERNPAALLNEATGTSHILSWSKTIKEYKYVVRRAQVLRSRGG
jgi:hypothetical protein